MVFKIPKDHEVLIHLPRSSDNEVNQPDEQVNDFKILIWNVYKGQLKNHFFREFKQLAKDCDFMMLQEAMHDDVMPLFLQKEFPFMNWWLAVSWLKKSNNHGTGVCIGSRGDLLESKTQFAHQRELWFLTPKMTLFTEFAIGHQRVLFVNTHVLNLTTDRGYRRQLQEIADVVRNYSGPVCLAGDFNSWSVKRYLIMKKVFRSVGLEHIDPDLDQRILPLDHLFLRDIDVVEFQIHHEMKGSDHLPLTAKLRIKSLI